MTRITRMIQRCTRTAGPPIGKAVLTGGLVVLITAGPTAGSQWARQSDSGQVVLGITGSESRRLGPAVIVAWNELAHDIAVAEDQFLTFKGQRALAIMHLAMHDALNSIVPVYERYAYG